MATHDKLFTAIATIDNSILYDDARMMSLYDYTIYEDMRKQGFVPLAGTECYYVTKQRRNILDVELHCRGRFVGRGIHKIEYLTEDGYITWRKLKASSQN